MTRSLKSKLLSSPSYRLYLEQLENRLPPGDAVGSALLLHASIQRDSALGSPPAGPRLGSDESNDSRLSVLGSNTASIASEPDTTQQTYDLLSTDFITVLPLTVGLPFELTRAAPKVLTELLNGFHEFLPQGCKSCSGFENLPPVMKASSSHSPSMPTTVISPYSGNASAGGITSLDSPLTNRDAVLTTALTRLSIQSLTDIVTSLGLGTGAGGGRIAESCGISSVTLQSIESPLAPNTGNGEPGTAIGLQIYPDALDGFDAADRSTVRINVTISPPQQGIVVYFTAIDVDDPSANRNRSLRRQ